MTKADKQFLFDLLSTPSPTGFEMPGQRVWAKHIGKHSDSVDCDTYGSTWAVLKGSSKTKSVMLEAHADEIGYMIKHITKDGFLYVDRVGGSDAATGRGRRLDILTEQGPVTGIIGNTAIHLRRDSLANEKAPQIHQLWVDVGASSREEVAEMGIRVGHAAVYQDGPMEMANKRLVGRALDNRIGGFIIAQVMKKIAKAKSKPNHSLLCLNAIQEEIGGSGAKMATHRLMPSVCICLDVTHATDTPGLSAAQYGEVKLGQGPSLTHGSANHPLVVERLMAVAEKSEIPIQHEAASRFTGTDTDKIFDVQHGVPSALVSLPLRCMHSVVETAHWDDIEATIDLLAAFVSSLKAGDDFSQKL
ncbi:M42 family metallopeptidase [Verrucomicrobiaceae bacterium R5-34]|uniref:M42 family metallopeptidase n=1 Tax=Oceaniferula flava TaxID=2800421 RepID=A0AAE2SAH7_9BACT|nr:M42 family metallopeptidase [Oceaniferula flavus]MBK1831488.1 M42 family metallopeptidase [Verrucomicrobiaceae bacterium R5-34]MBK1854273.1 M42 family metallopeptidase [Oceaniferula flavus]MBM1135579.1 M42 family metallopeptidase [Oceaniferula flavus]